MKDSPNDSRQPRAGLFCFRLFVTGPNGPLEGVIVSFVGQADLGQEVALGSLQSSRDGYVSFKVPFEALDRVTTVVASAPGAKGSAQMKTDATDGEMDCARTLTSESSGPETLRSLPSVLSPDAQDALLSSSSIAVAPRWPGSGGPCSPFVPTQISAPSYKLVEFVLNEPCTFHKMECGRGTTDVQFGAVLSYEVKWNPVGFSLGDLLYSTSLAPCEQVKIAVRDAYQSVAASRGESTSHSEAQSVYTTRASSVEERIKATTWGLGGGFGGAVSGKVNEIAIAVGINVAGDFRRTAAQTQQRVSDYITQKASLSVQENSTVVYEASQHESQTVGTRTITNHNRCHTLNLMYYGVNRSYRVRTRCVEAKDAIFLRYQNEEFTIETAVRRMHLLKGNLLLPELESCWNALLEYSSCCKSNGTVHELIAIVDGRSFSMVPRFFYITLTLKDGSSVATNPVLDSAGAQSLQLSRSINPADIVKVSVGGGFNPTSATISMRIEQTGEVVPLASGQDEDPSPSGWSKDVSPAALKIFEGCEELSCCANKLIDHLNCNKLYYNSLIWMSEDPNERYLRLRCCRLNDRSLMALVENQPLGVVGDMVAFGLRTNTKFELPPPVSTLVTLPTPGIHSEGVLGHCNTCEKKDDTVHRDCACCESEAANPELDALDSLDLSDILGPTDVEALLTMELPTSPKGELMAAVIKELLAEAQKGSDKARELLLNLIKELKPKS